MDDLKISGTENTPEVDFQSETGEFRISGRSFPEDAFDFFEPVFQWLDSYMMVPRKETKLIIQTDYFDTSSYKCFLTMIRKLEALVDKGKKGHVDWYYEVNDEEMREAGEDLKEIVSINFQLIEVKEGYITYLK